MAPGQVLPPETVVASDPALTLLAAHVRACRICRDAPLGKPLPHEPHPVLRPSSTARMLIAGQAPGARVHASGVPFDDRSGDRLREWLGVSSEAFYDTANFAILPMGFCFPGNDASGGDLPPRRECAPAWRAALMSCMPRVELVLAIGLYAQQWHLGSRRGATLTATVADWQNILEAPGRPRVLPLPHPSWRNTGWLKRHAWFETALLPRLRAEVQAHLARV